MQGISWGGGAEKIPLDHRGGGLPKNVREKLEIIIANPLYMNYEPSLTGVQSVRDEEKMARQEKILRWKLRESSNW